VGIPLPGGRIQEIKFQTLKDRVMNKLLATVLASVFVVSTAFAASHTGAPMAATPAQPTATGSAATPATPSAAADKGQTMKDEKATAKAQKKSAKSSKKAAKKAAKAAKKSTKKAEATKS
jgi:hypothetical protein